MPDEVIVQPSATSTTGDAPQGTPAPIPAVFDEAKVKELIAREVESVSRKFQSEKDKAVNEVRREAERARNEALYAKREADEAYGQLGAVNPQAAELTRLRSNDRRYKEQESQESVKKQMDEFDSKFRSSLTQSLEAMEINPTDPRIDWATDAVDYVEKQKRILASAANINKENRKTFLETERKKLSDEITAKVKKDLGVDSVDTSSPGSSSDGTDFTKKFANGDLPMTKANIDKYNKILNST
jgi:small-conductance mechanosensitive channel